jgi:prepilin-type N-terminal cleavage/methylation domain-containing protein
MNPESPNRRCRAEAVEPDPYGPVLGAGASGYVERARRDLPTRARPAGSRSGRSPAFTLLELVISLSILAIGLLGIQVLMIRQSKQVSRMEQWCLNDRTYYVVNQSEEWMRALRGPATLQNQPGQTAWSPPVVSRDHYEVTLESFTCPYGSEEASAQVTLTAAP